MTGDTGALAKQRRGDLHRARGARVWGDVAEARARAASVPK
jgi:hypothetical protein